MEISLQDSKKARSSMQRIIKEGKTLRQMQRMQQRGLSGRQRSPLALPERPQQPDYYTM
jgi:hypothetical protein